MTKSVNIELIFRRSCNLCKRVRLELIHQLEGFPDVALIEFNIDQTPALPDGRQAHIVPAIWVMNRLWYLGGFDSAKFKQKLERVIKKQANANAPQGNESLFVEHGIRPIRFRLRLNKTNPGS